MIGRIAMFKNYGRIFLLAFLAMTLTLGIFVLHMLAAHNFHVVSLGQVYRSGQFGGDALVEIIHERGIKSILNLRGPDGAAWYNSETNISSQLGVKHFDYELSAARELKDSEMDQILAMIKTAPKPLLIHCKSGADRTGLVGALYLYSVEGKSAESANNELTVFCGHLPYLFWRDTIAMDRSFWRYVNSHAPSISPIKAQFQSPLTEQNIPLPAKVAIND